MSDVMMICTKYMMVEMPTQRPGDREDRRSLTKRVRNRICNVCNWRVRECANRQGNE